MLTLANELRWTDKLAFVAASILTVGLLIGALISLRFILSRRGKKPSAPIDFDDPLIYPKETSFSLLAGFLFNGLVLYLAFYVSWPLWLRLLVALPFIAMGAFCCLFASVFIGDWLRARRSTSPVRLDLPPDAESISANRQRERLLVGLAACLLLLAIVCLCFFFVFRSWELLSLLIAIFGATCAGLAGFAILAILWRRVCAWRGHSFRQTDVFGSGSVAVYQCRHCGEQRFVSGETA